MGRTLCLVLGIFMLLFGFSTVACTHYVEQETPPGQVAPPQHQISAQPYRPEENLQPPPVVPIGQNDDHGKGDVKFDAETIVPTFERAYRANGSPRLAIFLNRSLSDEVREWRTRSRGVISMDGKVEFGDESKAKSWQGPGGVAAYKQQHMETKARTNPGDESWMWRFEEGFLSPFLDARVNIVDRATIMRLLAADSGNQGSAFDPMAVKKIEMDALVEKADFFIELLVRKDPTSFVGYAFKASAKEVNTGIIRANVTSLDWDYRGPMIEKVITTDHGYKITRDRDKGEAQLPETNIVSRDLALSLMRSLSHSWQQ